MRKAVSIVMIVLVCCLCLGLLACDGIGSDENKYITVSNEQCNTFNSGDSIVATFECDITNNSSQRLKVRIELNGTTTKIGKIFEINPNQTQHCVVTSRGTLTQAFFNLIVFKNDAIYLVYDTNNNMLEQVHSK